MSTNDFNTGFVVDQSPEEVFNAVINVRGWWSENLEGGSSQLNDEFRYRYTDLHKCTMKLIEVIPGQKVVWLVLDNYFKFTEDKKEWTGDTIEFAISATDNQTRLQFTHHGLVPAYECYDICYDSWTRYITKSLHSLVTTGIGQPNSKEAVSA